MLLEHLEKKIGKHLDKYKPNYVAPYSKVLLKYIRQGNLFPYSHENLDLST